MSMHPDAVCQASFAASPHTGSFLAQLDMRFPLIKKQNQPLVPSFFSPCPQLFCLPSHFLTSTIQGSTWAAFHQLQKVAVASPAPPVAPPTSGHPVQPLSLPPTQTCASPQLGGGSPIGILPELCSFKSRPCIVAPDAASMRCKQEKASVMPCRGISSINTGVCLRGTVWGPLRCIYKTFGFAAGPGCASQGENTVGGCATLEPGCPQVVLLTRVPPEPREREPRNRRVSRVR